MKKNFQGDDHGATKLEKRESRRIQVRIFIRIGQDIAIDISRPQDCWSYSTLNNQPWLGTKVGREEDRGEVKEVVEVAEEPEELQSQRRLLRRTFSMSEPSHRPVTSW